MKRLLLLLLSLFTGTAVFAQSYPTVIDQNSTAGQWLRPPQAQEAPGTFTGSPIGTANPTMPDWFSHSSNSIISLETIVGTPGSSVTTSHDYKISKLQANVQITPSVGTVFWLGALEDELNGYVLLGGTGPYPVNGFSDGHSWSYLVNNFFGQPCVGRWTPMGQSPNPLGTNYATAHATIAGGESDIKNYNVQSNTLIADYAGTLPANSVVVFHLGTEEVQECMTLVGPVWTASPTTTWLLTGSGGFTVPSSGTINVNVVSSTGAVVGTTAGYANAISFEFSGINLGPFVITAVPDGTHITVATNSGFATVAVPNNTKVNTYAGGYIDQLLSTSSGDTGTIVNNLVAALPSTGLLVLVGCPDPSLFPDIITTGFAASYHQTWLYWRKALSLLMPTTSTKIAGWDMNQVFADVITNYAPTNGMPGKYGFKNVTSNYFSGNPADYCFYAPIVGGATAYPTGAMYTYIAQSFIPFLKARKYVTPY